MQFRSIVGRIGAAFRRPVGAAVLSFLFPGWGQAAAGNRRRGAIVAIPALAVIGAFLLVILVDRHSIFNAAFDQQWLTSLLILDVAALVYHLWAVVDAYTLARPVSPQRRGRTTTAAVATARVPSRKWLANAGIAVIVSSTVLVHAGLGSVVMNWQGDLSCWTALTPCWVSAMSPGETYAMPSIDPADASGDPNVIHSPSSSGSGAASATPTGSVATLDPASIPSYQTTTNSADWASDGQLNVLLIGVDAGAGGSRNVGLRPDTMILLHVNIKTGQAAMYGIPRNTYCVPLPKGTAEHYPNISNAQITYGCPPYTWSYMLENLWQEAAQVHPGNFPYYQTRSPANDYMRGITALEQAIGTLTGLHIDGTAQVNLMGFVKLVDDLGGVTINVPTRVVDHPCGPKGTPENRYGYCAAVHGGYAVPEGTGDISLDFEPGIQHMDGHQALAYARTREFSTDYDRMKRQQLVLQSLRSTLDPCTILPRIPSLISDLGTAFWTNLPLDPSVISSWVGLAEHITTGNLKSVVLDPSTSGAKNNVLTSASVTTIRNVVAHSLDNVPASSPGGGGGGGGGFGC